MSKPILITGSSGLIGSALMRALPSGEALGFDIRDRPHHDTRWFQALREKTQGCRGIVHLAAISRVEWAQHYPQVCNDINLAGTNNVLDTAYRNNAWVLFGSSREVYGPTSGAVSEDAPLNPHNAYARSKILGEQAVSSTARTAILRFSNVYGSIHDHLDRVVPAFARSAAQQHPIHLNGPDCTFDFVHVHDVVIGILASIAKLDAGKELPPIHLTSGVPTSLSQLADICQDAGGGAPLLRHTFPRRKFDVSSFYGDPARAKELLGWQHTISVTTGVSQLVKDFQNAPASNA